MLKEIGQKSVQGGWLSVCHLLIGLYGSCDIYARKHAEQLINITHIALNSVSAS